VKFLLYCRGKDELENSSQEELNKLVDEFKAKEATAINNTGKKAQIKYLLLMLNKETFLT